MAHLHDVIDDDLHFKIDPDTRKISRTSENPIVIVQNDHNSERCSFEIPREIDGHDMTLCNNVRIHFLNADVANPTNMSKGVYEATDLDVLDIDPNTLLFTWLIHRNSTIHAGPLNFAISFQCTSEKIEADGSKSIIVEYEWNTLPDTEDISVSGGMDNSEVIAGEDYYDVVDTWLATITNLGETTKADVAAHITAETNSAINEAKQSIDDFAEEVKEHLGKQALSDTGVMVQETGTATDKVMSQDATTKALEEAKTFASSEAAAVRSDFNAKYTELGEDIGGLSNYKKLEPISGSLCKLETGKLYYVCRPKNTQTTTWNVTVSCQVRNWAIQTTTGGTKTINDITHVVSLPDFRDRAPDIYGFYIRVINDGSLVTVLDGISQKVKGTVSYEIMRDHDVHEVNDTYHEENIGYTENNAHCIFGSETYDKNGLYVAGTTVYEINEDLFGTTFTVNANGISNISKTGTSGLTDTYTIVLDDGTTKTFTVTNGDGIKSVTTPEYDDYETTYLVAFDSGATFSFKAPNANSIGIKTPATGAVIHAEDVIPAEHRVNVKVRSKNLIPYPYSDTTKTVNGITFTDNGDGSITANGTATGNAVFYFINAGNNFYIDGPVHLSGCPEGGSISGNGYSIRINYYVNGVETSGIVDSGVGNIGTFDNAHSRIYFVVLNGTTVNDLVVRPMLVSGTNEPDGYTPYVDVSTVKLTRCGKNMVNVNKIVGIGGTDKITIEGDSVTIAAGAQYGIRIMHKPNENEGVCLKAGETYTLSCNLSGEHHADSWGWRLFDVTGSAVVLSKSTELTYTPSKDITFVSFYIAMGQVINTPVVISNIQIEKGPVATDYEPYSGVEYDVYSNGQPATVVTSTSPTMTIFADKPGVIIDAVYNVDQTAAYNKLKSNVPDTPAVVGTPVATRVILEPGDSYVLKPDHMYFIHGSEDSSLQVVDSATGTNALRTVAAASDIQAMITSSGDGENYGQMFVCYLKDNAVLAYSDNNVVNSISWKPMKVEQIFAPKTKVKNTHATENAYVYDYGCP